MLWSCLETPRQEYRWLWRINYLLCYLQYGSDDSPAIVTISFTRPRCVLEYWSVYSLCSVASSFKSLVVKNTPLFVVPSSIYFLERFLASCYRVKTRHLMSKNLRNEHSLSNESNSRKLNCSPGATSCPAQYRDLFQQLYEHRRAHLGSANVKKLRWHREGGKLNNPYLPELLR